MDWPGRQRTEQELLGPHHGQVLARLAPLLDLAPDRLQGARVQQGPPRSPRQRAPRRGRGPTARSGSGAWVGGRRGSWPWMTPAGATTSRPRRSGRGRRGDTLRPTFRKASEPEMESSKPPSRLLRGCIAPKPNSPASRQTARIGASIRLTAISPWLSIRTLPARSPRCSTVVSRKSTAALTWRAWWTRRPASSSSIIAEGISSPPRRTVGPSAKYTLSRSAPAARRRTSRPPWSPPSRTPARWPARGASVPRLGTDRRS